MPIVETEYFHKPTGTIKKRRSRWIGTTACIWCGSPVLLYSGSKPQTTCPPTKEKNKCYYLSSHMQRKVNGYYHNRGKQLTFERNSVWFIKLALLLKHLDETSGPMSKEEALKYAEVFKNGTQFIKKIRGITAHTV
jgi:hypothetical protein